MCLIFSTVLCFAHCTVQLPLTAFSLTLCTWHVVIRLLKVLMFQYGHFVPMLIDCVVLLLPSALVPCIFLVPLPVVSRTTSLFSPPCLFRPTSVFVAFVCYVSRSPPVLSSLILCSSRSCLSSPLSKVSRPLPALNSRGRR